MAEEDEVVLKSDIAGLMADISRHNKRRHKLTQLSRDIDNLVEGLEDLELYEYNFTLGEAADALHGHIAGELGELDGRNALSVIDIGKDLKKLKEVT